MVHNMQFFVKYVYFLWIFDGIPHKIQILITESVNVYIYLSIVRYPRFKIQWKDINYEISHEKA